MQNEFYLTGKAIAKQLPFVKKQSSHYQKLMRYASNHNVKIVFLKDAKQPFFDKLLFKESIDFTKLTEHSIMIQKDKKGFTAYFLLNEEKYYGEESFILLNKNFHVLLPILLYHINNKTLENNQLITYTSDTNDDLNHFILGLLLPIENFEYVIVYSNAITKSEGNYFTLNLNNIENVFVLPSNFLKMAFNVYHNEGYLTDEKVKKLFYSQGKQIIIPTNKEANSSLEVLTSI